MSTQNAEVIELSLEKTIETKLVQSNVTDAVLSALKEKYGGMKLKAIDDKESYLEIKAAAKECGKVRTLAVKICKEGREEAVKTQKLWIAKEKEVVGKVAEVEDALDAEILRFDKEVERLENEEKERQEAAYINRQAMLTKMGATYVDGSFVLGGASFEAALIKGSEENIWAETVLPKFQAEYEKIEAVRIEEEKKKQAAEAELKRQQDELQRQQAELKAQQEEMQRQKAESERLENEKQHQQQLAEQKRVSELQSKRFALLLPFNPSGADVDMATLWNLEEDKFNEILENKKEEFKKQQLEQQRIAEEKNQSAIELAKQEAIKKEQQRVAEEEAKKQAELEAATDKTKWAEFLKEVGNISFYDMKSNQYKTKMSAARIKINEILGL
jgi:virulence-associated protein VapD